MNSLRLRTISIAIGFVLVLAAANAQASSLAELFQGASLTAGNNIYSDWMLTRLTITDGGLADFDRIQVTPLDEEATNLGIGFFAPSGALGTPRMHDGISSVLLEFSFNARTLDSQPFIQGNSIQIGSTNFFSKNGVTIRLIEDVKEVNGLLLAQTVAITGRDDPPEAPSRFDMSTFSPHSTLRIQARLDIVGLSPNDMIDLESFEMRFQQAVPEPASLILASKLLIGLLARGFRRRPIALPAQD